MPLPTLLSCKPLTMVRGVADYTDTSRSQQRLYRLVFASPVLEETDFDLIEAVSLLPSVGDLLKPGDLRRLTKKSVAAGNQTGCEFLVTCDYETPSFNAVDADPLARPDEVNFDGTSTMESWFRDHSEVPKFALNSAGEPFESYPERSTGNFGITIVGNRSAVNPSLYAQYLRPNAVNNNAFTVRGISIGIGEAKMTSITFSRQAEGHYQFWQIKWALALAPTWDQELPDRGFNEKVSGALKPITILVGTAPNQKVERPTKPYPLNGNGAKKANAFDEPATLTYKPYPQRAFSFGWTVAA